MFINRLNQLYKPERRLYYREVSELETAEYLDGAPDEAIGPYRGAFGTYDIPGIFFLRSLDTPVIGIEYRTDDERVKYPADLPSVLLEGTFFYSIEIDQEIEIRTESIRQLFAQIAQSDDAHRLYSDLSISRDPDVIAVFSSGKKLRILYECRLDRDWAVDIIRDDHENLDTEMLYQKAFYDPITGHPTWNHLVSYLEMPMDGGIRDYAFAHFDVKAFRVINEVYGHIAANKVLTRIAQAMNDSDMVLASARCHNDNFAMLIRDMPPEEMTASLEAFFEGLSVLEEDDNYRILYRCGVVPMQRAMLAGNRVADAAKTAQSLGNNPNRTDIIVYTDRMHDDILWSNYIKAYVDTAIAGDEFVVYLQPKMDIRTERIKGAEALVRWNYRKEELLSPARFVPFFEKDGTIGKIDEIVLDKVSGAFAKWKEQGRPLFPISVNLSRSQLYDRSLVGRLTQIVDSHGVSHDLIDFELTESATYDNMERMLEVLNDLRARGFRISMDDFGTGYSSLSLLTQMPLDTLKIDKSFVDKVGTGKDREGDTIVIRHIISLAKELGIVCLAEGAESRTQVERLRELGCEAIQGYYYSRPIPIDLYEDKYLKNIN
ncbi:MAG: bifunctional diguanylate cyclase/phosphodiesterase [Lachnospiraceae bacterium]|nr:bifunctional diguanylate cyclase/phosphodiesterase [Lachnospiraceae bacterium]